MFEIIKFIYVMGKKILMIFNNCYKLYELEVLYLLIEKNNKKYE